MPRDQHIKDSAKIQELAADNKRLRSDVAEERAKTALLQDEAKKKAEPLSKREIGGIIVGLIPTLAGIVADDRATVLLCLIISWAAAMYVCYLHKGNRKGQIAFALIGSLVYFGIGYRWNTKFLKGIREDTYNHLDIDMLTPYLGSSPPRVPFVVKNGGSSPIVRHRNSCTVNAIRDTTNAGFNVPGGILNPWIDNTISSGGDGQTDWCGIEWMGFNNPIRGLDITIRVEYQTALQKNSDSKEWRFVAERTWGQHWFQESPSQKGNYCDGTAGRS